MAISMARTIGRSINRENFLLFLAVGLVLGFRTRNANIFADDAGFIHSFINGDLNSYLRDFQTYVPGRNLHILWQYSLYGILGTSKFSFIAYHVLQSLLFVSVGYSINLILLKLSVRKLTASLVGLVFIFLPFNTMVLLWPSALPMHIFSSLFVLIFILIYLSQISSGRTNFGVATLLFFGTLAMFTYDQSAAVIIIVLLATLYENIRAFLVHSRIRVIQFKKVEIFVTLLILCIYASNFMLNRATGNGPIFTFESISRLAVNLFPPLKVYQKLHSDPNYDFAKFFGLSLNALLIVFSIAFICLSLLILRLPNLRLLLFKMTCDLFSPSILIWFGMGLIAYLPIATWYISPRHLYLPFAFWSIGIGILIEKSLGRTTKRKITRICTSLLLFSILIFSVLQFNNGITNWLHRDILRQSTYALISNFENNYGENLCFHVLNKNSDSENLFYSEQIPPALHFYAPNESSGSAKCGNDDFEVSETANFCKELATQQKARWFNLSPEPNFGLSPLCP
jgi:hypothetical protein